MVSRNDLAIGVLLAGIIIYLFSPAGPLYVPVMEGDMMSVEAHANTHYIGGAFAIFFGLSGLAVYKKVSKVTVGISVLSVVLGIVFALLAPGGPLFPIMQPHGLVMESIGGVTALLGLVGIVGSAALKPKK
ncbi:MAG: hypothetical protein ABSF82_05780 [Candidatus Bathyarchaeia archaeon]|jgi:hypothetical protein